MRRFKKTRMLAAAAVLIGLLAGSIESMAAGQSGEAQAGQAATGTVRIVHVNDVHSYVAESDTAIGYPKLAAFFARMKAEDANTIIVDAGDSLAGTAASAFDRGASLPALLNTVGFDVMAAGNADFSYGKDTLKAYMDELNYPVLCGNMFLKDGNPLFDGSMTMTLANGMRVGIVSVTSPESARSVADVFNYRDPFDICQKLVDQLRPNVDLVVGLVHLGDAESETFNSVHLAERVKGLDVIVDGHSHTVLEQGRVVNGVLIAQAGEYSKYVGVVELELQDGALVKAESRLVGKAEVSGLAPKADTASQLAELETRRDAYFAQVVGRTETAISGERNVIRTQETSAGNLFADAMREAAQADLAVMPAGIIGGDIPPGNITKGDILNIARASSEVIKKEMKGSDIDVLVNEKVMAYPEPSPGYIQVSGMSFAFNPLLKVSRVTEIRIGGELLDPNKTYVVAMVAGMTNDPGAVNGRLLGSVGMTDAILEAYIASYQTVAPQVEGRSVAIR